MTLSDRLHFFYDDLFSHLGGWLAFETLIVCLAGYAKPGTQFLQG